MTKIFHFLLILPLIVFFSTDKTAGQNSESPGRSIKIGLLVPDSNSLSAIRGSELAIREANEKGGLNGHRFGLVVRYMDGPWGTGSKEAVNLIFRENVWAILGSHDGRNAHIVEQAATKSSVVFVSAWPGDPTLSQAFVPWFFNCVPNDNQQAESLTKEIYLERKFKKVIVITSDDYDSKSATDSFLNSVIKSGRPEPVIYNYDNPGMNPDDLLNNINRAGTDCVVLFCTPQASIKIAEQFSRAKLSLPLFGSLMILNENILSPGEIQVYDKILSVPSGEWMEQDYISFSQKFRRSYNINPGIVASYSYDAMNVLLQAIKIAGSNDRELIQKSLQEISFHGVTGLIRFDDKGNRSGEFETSGIIEGVPADSK